MPLLPDSTRYGYITGRIITAIGDITTDADLYPDAVPAAGTVTFTPNVSLVRNSTDKTIMVPRPVTVTLDSDGYLVPNLTVYAPVGNGVPNQGRGVYLVASDGPGMNPTGWSYTVSFQLSGANGVALDMPSFDIVVTTNAAIDLVDVAPANTDPIVSVAGATALAAQAAASATAAAASAAAAAASAAGGGGGGGGGVDTTAMHFRGKWTAPGQNYVTIKFDTGMPDGINFFGAPWTIVDKVDPLTGYTKALKSPTLAPNNSANLRIAFPAPARADSPAYVYNWVSTEPDVGIFYAGAGNARSGTTDTQSHESTTTLVDGATSMDLVLYKNGNGGAAPAGDDAVYLFSMDIPVTPTADYGPGDLVSHDGHLFVRTAPASNGQQYNPPAANSEWSQLI